MALSVWVRQTGRGQAFSVHPTYQVPRGLICEKCRLEFLVELDGQPLPRSHDLFLNDYPAPRLSRRGEAVFSFEPDFFAGELRVSVIHLGRMLTTFDIEVDPDFSKLTKEEYALLVSEVAKKTFALYRLSQVSMPAYTSFSTLRNNVVTLELIRTNIDRFERAVSKLSDQPVRTLVTNSVEKDIRTVRRIDDRALKDAARSKKFRLATSVESKAAPRIVKALGGRWVQRVTVNNREESLATYENRAILGFIRWLRAELSATSARLSSGDLRDIPDEVSELWHLRISTWRNRLAAIGRRNLFTNLVPVKSLRSTSVFRLNPEYAAAFSAMMRIRSGLGGGSAVLPNVPIDRTYQLYEIWCYIGILAAAADAFPNSRQHIKKILEGLEHPSAIGTTLLQGADSDIYLEDDLVLTYQKKLSVRPDTSGARTAVVEAVPDICLSRLDDSGKCVGMTILDPKYRSGASLNDGIRDLHAYRDSIVDREGDRLVRASVVLAPRSHSLPICSGPIPIKLPVVVAARPMHNAGLFSDLLNRAIATLPASSVA